MDLTEKRNNIPKFCRNLITQETPDSCWIWHGCVRSDGYGQVTRKGTNMTAHRYIYQAIKKRKIAKGLHVDHLCRNRTCCNPSHLEPVTPVENLMRSDIQICAKNAKKTECKHGHPFNAENTIYRKTPCGIGRDCLQCKRNRLTGNPTKWRQIASTDWAHYLTNFAPQYRGKK